MSVRRTRRCRNTVSTLAREYQPGFKVPEHAQRSNELIYAVEGDVEIFSGQTRRLIPPHPGIWIPARVPHRAIERLVSGISVRQVAFELGYRQASPFIGMFRRTKGTTPRAWLPPNAKI